MQFLWLAVFVAIDVIAIGCPAYSDEYELVLHGGRVMEPESGLDAIRDVGVNDGDSSALFGEGFQEKLGVSFHDLQWSATGERLTEESFGRYRKQGGLVIVHNNTETGELDETVFPDKAIRAVQ